MKQLKGTIYSKKQINKDTFKIEIKSDLIEAHSGQFISILCDNKTLRRPFSISNFEKISDNQSLTTVLFKLKGEGTKYISSLKIQEEIDFLAPLGNGFNIENKKSLLVGAGIGIAPMLFLKKELNEKSIENYLIAGFKAQDEIIEGFDEVKIGGSVLDNLEKIIKEKNIEIIYSCGPSIVLKLISQLAQKLDIKAQIAMEKIMACSIGVCRGCVIQLKQNGEVVQKTICKDGPVFSSKEVIWE